METSTLADRVYEILKIKILKHEFALGQKLNLTTLAKELNVSNTPVREAISRLEKVGLVEIVPYSGPYVRSLSPSELAHVYDVRIALEELAVRLAAISAPPADQMRLREIHQTYAQALEENTAEAAREADIGFHQAIARASGNDTLSALLQNLSDWIRLFIQLRFPTGRPADIVIQEHEQILAALLEGDKDKAGKAMRQHLVAAKADLIQPLLAQTDRQGLGDRADVYPNVWDENTNSA